MAVKKGAYLLPSSMTLVNLGLGFFSIIQSINGIFRFAALAIIFGHIADIIDGIVARMTKTTSSFGLEFDSFADWITFGIAPAILVYQLQLHKYGELGFGIALFFVITGSLRLAKFNIRAKEDSANGYFVGLPIPGAGGMVAAIVLLYDLSSRPMAKTIPGIMVLVPYIMKLLPVIMFVLSLLMITQIRFFSTKQTRLFRPRSLRSIIFWVVAGLLMYAYPQNFTFILYVAYIVWGLSGYVIRMKSMRRKHHEQTQ
ncbi:MAG: CDP-diacylglycerol--serine O-phosphatidyltransferase [Elusimicrobia bacterium]|nr:CDP-diacylglycerol--serine O-phosphatidyltransferase [Elusimicrobiota bacterium]MBD3412321.1 CDP-diacylglycerol--serine O-phosphatidyltransferase [Elusimicrobiota bacterium]